MRSYWRLLPDAAVMFMAIYASWQLPRWLSRAPWLRVFSWLSTALLLSGFVLALATVRNAPISFYWMTVQGAALGWGCCLVLMLAVAVVWRQLERLPHSPARRLALRSAGVAAIAAPATVATFGILVGRDQFRLREVSIPCPGLPRDLDGLRLVQLSDIHLSPFLSRKELRRCVDMANETRAHAAFVTGDLITGSYDPIDTCLDELKRLRSDAGTFGCMGNHEAYIQAEAYVQQHAARRDMRFLRAERTTLRFGSTALNLAGVDYQRKGRPYLREAAKLVVPGEFNLLLCHNPDAFPVAARQGWHLTLAGHTHGGQVNVEILEQDLNLVRAFVTPYVYGHYQEGRSSIYVTRGIGTVGVPLRVGAPPEVALVRLCAT